MKAVSQNMLSTSEATGQQTILVVENCVEAREMMKTMLEQMGYRVLQAADGPEAMYRMFVAKSTRDPSTL
jgi:CheY-like chemotaxis protein